MLVWLRTNGEVAVVGAGCTVSRSTAYRYRVEGIQVLAAQARDLYEGLQEVAEPGWSRVVLDGKLIRTDRCAETPPASRARRSTCPATHVPGDAEEGDAHGERTSATRRRSWLDWRQRRDVPDGLVRSAHVSSASSDEVVGDGVLGV